MSTANDILGASPASTLGATLGVPTNDPSIAAALSSVAAQAQAEGGDALEVAARQATLLQSYSDIFKQGNVDAQSALKAAEAYVGQNHTIAGAIDTASGLVGAVEASQRSGTTPVDIVSNFSGPLMGGIVLSGELTAGAGAAITAGIAVAAALLDKLGLFAPPSGQNIDGQYFDPPPDFVIGSMGVYVDDKHAPSIAPGSALWRRFPEPSNPSDAGWFAPAPSSTGVLIISEWRGAKWMGPLWSAGKRMVDVAFSDYAAASTLAPVSTTPKVLGLALPALTLPEQLQAVGEFSRAYFTAWKANKEYWLNGRKGGTDAQVLEHAVRVWNRAHEAGKGIDLRQAASPYFASQIGGLVSSPSGSDVMSRDKLGIHLNTGPLKKKTTPTKKAPPMAINMSLPPIKVRLVGRAATPAQATTLAAHQAAAAAPNAKPGLSTGAKWGLGAGAVTIAGLAAKVAGFF